MYCLFKFKNLFHHEIHFQHKIYSIIFRLENVDVFLSSPFLFEVSRIWLFLQMNRHLITKSNTTPKLCIDVCPLIRSFHVSFRFYCFFLISNLWYFVLCMAHRTRGQRAEKLHHLIYGELIVKQQTYLSYFASAF